MFLELYTVIKAYKCAELLEFQFFQSYAVVAAKLCWYIIQRKCKVFARRRNKSQCVIQYCVLPVGCAGSEPAAQLCEKAKHHSASVCKVDGHLARQRDDPDSTERYTLHGCVVPLIIWMSNTDIKAGCSWPIPFPVFFFFEGNLSVIYDDRARSNTWVVYLQM